MSMHLEGPWLSTTGKRKGKKKFASSEAKRKAEQLDKQWKDLLKTHGIEQEERKRKRALTSEVWKPSAPNYRGSSDPKPNSLITTWDPCTVPAPKVYTGTKVKGIATMHKSNAVPVFSDEEAVDISKMRR